MTKRPYEARVVRLSRRGMLLGLGVGLTAPAVLSSPASATPAVSAPAVEPECLADLIEMGAVTRGDLVAR